MNMKNFLAGVFVAIKNYAVTAVGDPEVFCDLPCSQDHPSCKRFVPGCQIIYRRDMTFRNYDHMYRGLRLNIPEGHNTVILKKKINRNIFRGYLAEYTIGTHNKAIITLGREFSMREL